MHLAKILQNARALPSFWKPAGLAAAFACAAFTYFWLNQTIQFQRSVAEAATVSRGQEANRPPAARSSKSARTVLVSNVPIVVPKRPNEHETEFTLTESKDLQKIGVISIRLRAAHPATHSYDLTLKINKGHEWNKLNVKENQPIPLLRGRHSNQLVVYAVFPNRVSGYIERVQPTS